MKKLYTYCLGVGILLALGLCQSQAASVGQGGYGIVVGLSGDPMVRFPEGSGHEYPTGTAEVEEGKAYSEGHIFATGSKGRLCVVLTPGAVICVGEQTNVKLIELVEMTAGLPSSEKEVIRKIRLEQIGGSVLFYGGAPSPNNKFEIHAAPGVIKTSGATFEALLDKGEWKYIVREGRIEVVVNSKSIFVTEGETGSLKVNSTALKVAQTTSRDAKTFDEFELCDDLYPYLDPLVNHVAGLDYAGLADFVGKSAGVELLGNPTVWNDVSPTVRAPELSLSSASRNRARLPAGRLIPREEMWNWYRSVGVLKGVNYVPRYAVNAIEMWQEGLFDEDIIDEELGWANDVGFGVLRVPLSFHVWVEDSKAFIKRMDKFLDIADHNNFKTAFILLDDLNRTGGEPQHGKQKEPIPGVHNSQWTPNPGAQFVTDRSRWPIIESYVKDIVSHFKKDDRVIFWDVYQAPGASALWDKSLPLLESAFEWVRSEKPQQPLTAGPWTNYGSPMSVRIMELSDFVSLQSFGAAVEVNAKLKVLEQFGRPVICTDWLYRQGGNTFENILPLFAEQGVGWFSRGLVKGRTQWYLPDTSTAQSAAPELWQQDVLHEDGKPYDQGEVDAIRAFNF